MRKEHATQAGKCSVLSADQQDHQAGLRRVLSYVQERSPNLALGRSIDEELFRVVRMIVPHFCDAAWIDRFAADGSVERIAKGSGDEDDEQAVWLEFTEATTEASAITDRLKIPIADGKQRFGMLSCLRRPGRPSFCDAERQLAQTIGSQLATCFSLHTASVAGSDASANRNDGRAQGAEFIVRLPACEPPSRSHASSLDPVLQSHQRVLIVDDRRENELVLKALVGKLGPYETRSAGDGPAALSLLQDFQPDLILLDLGLPGMSGLELAREIRKLEHCRDALLVALTGYDDDDLRREATASGVDLYQLKPASIAMLREVLRHPKLVGQSFVE